MKKKKIQFGSILKEYRKRKKINQKKLTQKAGISPGYVSLIETSTRKPSREIVRKLEKALNLNKVESEIFYKSAEFCYEEEPEILKGKFENLQRFLQYPKNKKAEYFSKALHEIVIAYSNSLTLKKQKDIDTVKWLLNYKLDNLHNL